MARNFLDSGQSSYLTLRPFLPALFDDARRGGAAARALP